MDALEVLGSDEACLHSLTILTTLSESEKAGIREIPIRCWKVVKAARCKVVGGVEVHLQIHLIKMKHTHGSNGD